MDGHEAVFLQPLLDGPAPRGALGLVTAPFHADTYTFCFVLDQVMDLLSSGWGELLLEGVAGRVEDFGGGLIV